MFTVMRTATHKINILEDVDIHHHQHTHMASRQIFADDQSFFFYLCCLFGLRIQQVQHLHKSGLKYDSSRQL